MIHNGQEGLNLGTSEGQEGLKQDTAFGNQGSVNTDPSNHCDHSNAKHSFMTLVTVVLKTSSPLLL